MYRLLVLKTVALPAAMFFRKLLVLPHIRTSKTKSKSHLINFVQLFLSLCINQRERLLDLSSTYLLKL